MCEKDLYFRTEYIIKAFLALTFPKHFFCHEIVVISKIYGGSVPDF